VRLGLGRLPVVALSVVREGQGAGLEDKWGRLRARCHDRPARWGDNRFVQQPCVCAESIAICVKSQLSERVLRSKAELGWCALRSRAA